MDSGLGLIDVAVGVGDHGCGDDWLSQLTPIASTGLVDRPGVDSQQSVVHSVSRVLLLAGGNRILD
jgi:hypothetical protein